MIMHAQVRNLAFLFVLLISNVIYGQSSFYPLNDEINLKLEKAFFDNDLFHSSIKPYHLFCTEKSDSALYSLNISNLNNFTDKILNKNFLEKSANWGNVHLNPIISILPLYGRDDGKIFNNYLFGLSLSGRFGKKMDYDINGFYGTKSYPDVIGSIIDSTGILPSIGKYESKNGQNYRFARLTGYLSYSPMKYLNLKLGLGRHFWGDGYRSLFLSDNSADFPYFQTTMDVWKFNYVWLVGALSDKNANFEDNKFRPKFLVAHYLSYNATKWLNLSFFEALVSNPTDSSGLTRFNPSYLNPVIFLRPVEFASGSTDNVIMGLGIKLKFLKKYQFYGQFLLDEFIFSEIRSGKGWWGNKFGLQTGIKLFNLFGIENMMSRIEFNRIRPYTYSYYYSFGNYGNRFQPLAHPLGANLRELVLENHYHYKRFSFSVNMIAGEAGTDSDSENYGQDIYKPNTSRISDYNIRQGQGKKANYFDIGLRIAMQLNQKAGINGYASVNYKDYLNFKNKPNGMYVCFGISSSLISQRFAE
jgi:hypothetical protein